jgi:TIGR03009 family protein
MSDRMRRTIVRAWIGGLGLSALVGSMWIAEVRVMGQAPIVQPKSAGYGGAKSGAGQAGAGQIGQGGAVADPQRNPQLNPQFNPQLNAQGGNRVQNQLQQALRDGQEFQMQGPNNGGQVIQQRPFPELTPQEQAHIDQILAYWEQETAKIERFGCEFSRWEFDSQAPGVQELARQLGRGDVTVAASQGVVRFQKPDRGLFKTEVYTKMTGQMTKDRQVELKVDPNNSGEWVVCDGKFVWDYDRKEKIRTKLELPPEMQGLGIMNSPLPFLFGVKADEIKERYWVRAISAGVENGKPVENKYAVEAYPKYPVDAVNYHHVQIVLDREMFLPVLMVLYMPEWSDQAVNANGVVIEPRDKRMVYQFSNRQINSNIFQRLSEKLWQQDFIPVDPGAGWKTNEIPYLPAQPQGTAQVPGVNPGAVPGVGGAVPGVGGAVPGVGGGVPRTANPNLPSGVNPPR